MNVSVGKADIRDCPYATDDLIKQIGPSFIDKRSWYEKLIGLTVGKKQLQLSTRQIMTRPS